MLHRTEAGGGVVVVGQPAHARFTGIIGRAWGNAPFWVPPCPHETTLAADAHEIGMVEWERVPTWNAATGLPHAYTELTQADHLALWRDVGSLLAPQNRYVALLASRHGTWIFSEYEDAPTDAESRAALLAYFRRERAFQRTMRGSLLADPYYAAAVGRRTLARTRSTFIVWDRIAVHATYGAPGVGGIPDPYIWDAVPTVDGGTTRLVLANAGRDRWTLDPWPLAVPSLTLHGEGRFLAGRYVDTAAMRAALDAAPWVRWESVLIPA